MTTFDPDSFLAAETSEVNTRRPPIPENNPASPDGSYMAIIGEVKTRSGTIGKGERTGQPWLSMNVPLQIDLPAEVQEKLNTPKVTITDMAFIDLTPSNTIDNSPGKNRRQREYRDATDLNKPGEKFAWNMLMGRPVKVFIKHEAARDNSGTIVETVRAIAKP